MICENPVLHNFYLSKRKKPTLPLLYANFSSLRGTIYRPLPDSYRDQFNQSKITQKFVL